VPDLKRSLKGRKARLRNPYRDFSSLKSPTRFHEEPTKVAPLRFLISFDDGSMDHIPEEDMPSVGEAAHQVVREAKDAGVWIFGCGLLRQQSTIVATDGTVKPGPVPETKAVVGGFSIIDVSSREEAHVWAAKFAAACRCAQEVREIMYDPES
jgi:hypothetical protein